MFTPFASCEPAIFPPPTPPPAVPLLATPPAVVGQQVSPFLVPQPTNAPLARTMVQRVSEKLNVKDFGPCGTSSTGIVANSAPAFNALFAQVRASLNAVSNTTFRIEIPNDFYYTQGPINATGLISSNDNNNSIVIECNGATLVGAFTGGIVLDDFGSNFTKILNLNITSGSYVSGSSGIPSIGFAAGISNTGNLGVSNNMELHNVNIIGDFSLACAYFISTETSTCYNLRCYNTDAGAGSYCIITDGQNHFGVSSTFSPMLLPADTPNSFDSMMFITPDFRHQGGGSARWIGDCTSHRYLGGFIAVQSTVAATVLWLSATSGGGGGVSDLYDDVHVETTNCTDIYLLSGPQVAPPFYGLTYIDANPQASNSIFKCASGITGPYATNIKIKLIGYTNGALKMWDNASLWNWTGDIAVPNGGNICATLPSAFEGRLAIGHNENAALTVLTVGFGATTSPTVTSGSGVPAATQPSGSIYMRTGGSVGARVYVSQGGGTWLGIAGV